MNAPERALSNEPRVNLAAFLLADKPAERTAFVTPERSLAYGALATCVRELFDNALDATNSDRTAGRVDLAVPGGGGALSDL